MEVSGHRHVPTLIPYLRGKTSRRSLDRRLGDLRAGLDDVVRSTAGPCQENKCDCGRPGLLSCIIQASSTYVVRIYCLFTAPPSSRG